VCLLPIFFPVADTGPDPKHLGADPGSGSKAIGFGSWFRIQSIWMRIQVPDPWNCEKRENLALKFRDFEDEL